jgi:hypothetical protein
MASKKKAEASDVAGVREVKGVQYVPVMWNGKPGFMSLDEAIDFGYGAPKAVRDGRLGLSTWDKVDKDALEKLYEGEGLAGAALGAARGATFGVGPAAFEAASKGGGKQSQKALKYLKGLQETQAGPALAGEVATTLLPWGMEALLARAGKAAGAAGSAASHLAPALAPAGGSGGAIAGQLAAPARNVLGGVRAASAAPLEGEILSGVGRRAGAMAGPEITGEVVPGAARLGRGEAGLAKAPIEGEILSERPGIPLRGPEAEGEAVAQRALPGRRDVDPLARTQLASGEPRPLELGPGPERGPIELGVGERPRPIEVGAAPENPFTPPVGVKPAAYERAGVSAGAGRKGSVLEEMAADARAVDEIPRDPNDLGFFNYDREARRAITNEAPELTAAEVRSQLKDFELEHAGKDLSRDQKRVKEVLEWELQKKFEKEELFRNSSDAERAAAAKVQDQVGTLVPGGGRKGAALADIEGTRAVESPFAEAIVPPRKGGALAKVGDSPLLAMQAESKGLTVAERATEAKKWFKEQAGARLTPEQQARNAEKFVGPKFEQEAKDLPGTYLGRSLKGSAEEQAKIEEILAQIKEREQIQLAGKGGMQGPSGAGGGGKGPPQLPPEIPGAGELPPGPGGARELPPGPAGSPAGRAGPGALPPQGGTGSQAAGALPPQGGTGPQSSILTQMMPQTGTPQNPGVFNASPSAQAAMRIQGQQQAMAQGLAKASGVLPGMFKPELAQAFLQGASSRVEHDLLEDEPVNIGAAVASGVGGVLLAGAAGRALARVAGPAGGGAAQITAGGTKGLQSKLQQAMRERAFLLLRPTERTFRGARKLGIVESIGEQLLTEVPKAMGKKSLAHLSPGEVAEGIEKVWGRYDDAIGDMLKTANMAVKQGNAPMTPAAQIYNTLGNLAQKYEGEIGWGPLMAEHVRQLQFLWAKDAKLINSAGQFAHNAAAIPTDLRRLKDLSIFARKLAFQNELVPELGLKPARAATAEVRSILEDALSTQIDNAVTALGGKGGSQKYEFIKKQWQAANMITEMAETEIIRNARAQGTVDKIANYVQGAFFGEAITNNALQPLFAGGARSLGAYVRENAGRWALAGMEKLAGGVAIDAEKRAMQEALEVSFDNFLNLDLSKAAKASTKLPSAAQATTAANNLTSALSNPVQAAGFGAQAAANASGISPQIAQSVQGGTKKALEALAGFLPTAYNRTQLGGGAGPEYDPYEVKRFAIAMRAITDPTSIARDLEDGTLSPTSVEALKKANPDLLEWMQQRINAKLAQHHGRKGQFHLSPMKMAALSVLNGGAGIPSLKPSNIKANQAMYMQLGGGADAGGAPTGSGKGAMAGGQGAASKIGGSSFAKSNATVTQRTAAGF